MNRETHLLSDEMMKIYYQIKNLNLLYIQDSRFYFMTRSKGNTYYEHQSVCFDLDLSTKRFRLILCSEPDRILLDGPFDGFDDFSMMEFLEMITPDLAELLYFNIDLWRKYNC